MYVLDKKKNTHLQVLPATAQNCHPLPLRPRLPPGPLSALLCPVWAPRGRPLRTCLSYYELLSGFQPGPVKGREGGGRGAGGASRARRPEDRDVAQGVSLSPCSFPQPCPHLCKESPRHALSRLRRSGHLWLARAPAGARSAAGGPGGGHLRGPCGAGRPSDTASVSRRCPSRAAPGRACRWGSTPPEGSGRSSSRAGC